MLARRCLPRVVPDLRSDWSRPLERVDEGVQVAFGEPERKLTMHPGAFREAFRNLFGTAASGREVPFVVHRAATGDFRPFLGRIPRGSSMFSEGLYLSISCAEGTSRTDPAEVGAYTKGTFLGDYRVRQQLRACRAWPKGEVPMTLFEPVRTQHPTLMISGEFDATTPPDASRQVCSNLANCQLLVIPSMGHVPFDIGLWMNGMCLMKLMADFFELDDPRRIDTSCIPKMAPPPFATAR